MQWLRGRRTLWLLGAVLMFSVGAVLQRPRSFFSIVLLPDTQNYTDIDHEAYFEQARAIVRWRDSDSIKFVVHLGDVTDSNLRQWNQWVIASRAHAILEKGRVPYSVVPGNHDMPYMEDSRSGINQGGDDRDSAMYRDLDTFNSFFGPARFTGKPWSGYRGAMPGAPENKYWFFEHGALRFMVIGLEMAPRKDAVCWAGKLARENSDRRAIVTTHCYQSSGGGHRTNCASKYFLVGSNGKVLFDELVTRHSNVSLVLSGHINGAAHKARERELVDTLTGRTMRDTVHEILTDYQDERDPARVDRPKSGNGWLRVMTFYPESNRVQVEARTVKSYINRFFEAMPSSPRDSAHSYSFAMDLGPLQKEKVRHAGMLSEFHDRTVNSDSRGQQRDPAVAANAHGDFFVAWTDDRDTNGKTQIHGRMFDASGCARYQKVPVNKVSAGNQRNPAVAMDSAGGVVVVWEDDRDGNGKWEIIARGFGPDGRERFGEITVNAASAGQQVSPAVAADAQGNFVVVWEDDRNNNRVYEIRARGFHADGRPRFAERKPNTVSSGQQRGPHIAMAPNGEFVVVWADNRDNDLYYDVYARGYTPVGDNRVAEFKVASERFPAARFLSRPAAPRVAADSAGRFVVTWADDRDRNGSYQIRARGFEADGRPWFDERTVNSAPAGQQIQPDIAMSRQGDFVVAWSDDRNDNQWYQIRAREFTAGGAPRGADKTINDNSRGQQQRPVVAVMSPDGRYVAAWEDDLNKNAKYEILARGMPAPAPAAANAAPSGAP